MVKILGKSNRNGRVTAVPTHQLTGTFSVLAVGAMAVDDARAGFYTDAWGDDNRAPRAIGAINAGPHVSAEVVAHDLHGDLDEIEGELEASSVRIPPAEEAVISAGEVVETDKARTKEVEERCKTHGLSVPDHRLARRVGEGVGLTALGVGDEKFNSLSFQVYGLSDKAFSSWLPISEDQLVAGSVIAAMLMLVAIAGTRMARLGHNLEQAKAKGDPSADRRRRVRVGIEATAVLLGIAGGIGCLVGVSGVRAAFLEAEGVAAHQHEFLLIQLAIAAAGFLLAWALAHPFDRDWRVATHKLRKNTKQFSRASAEFVGLVGVYNALIRSREAVLGQALAHTNALVAHAAMEGPIYAREHQLNLAEPTTERLLPDELPRPTEPRLATELGKYFNGKPSMFKKYEPYKIEDVKSVLAQPRAQQDTSNEQVNDRIEEAVRKSAAAPSSAKAKTNGHGTKKPVKK